MAAKSAFSIVGLTHKALLAAEEQGYTPELLNAAAEDPRRLFGQMLLIQLGLAKVRFLDRFRETGEFSVQLPALPRPSLEELRAKYDWIKSIKSDTSPTGPVTLTLGTVLRPDESSINGTEYERRRSSLPILGYQHFKWLVDHQDEHPAFKALLGKFYIDGPGIIVVNVHGDRSFPCLSEGGGRWRLLWLGTGYALSRRGRVAVSGPLRLDRHGETSKAA